MVAWMRMVVQQMDFDVPAWSVLLAFSAFDLRNDVAQHGLGGEFRNDNIARLSVAFDVREAERRAQLQAHIQYAKACYKRNQVAGVFAAWRKSLVDSEGRRRLPRDDALTQVIHHYQAWDGIGTSNVERGLSRITEGIGRHRQTTSCASRWYEAKIITYVRSSNAAMRQRVIQDAIRIWDETWRTPKRSGIIRPLHFSNPGRQNLCSTKTTEREFIKLRRERAADAACRRSSTRLTREDIGEASSDPALPGGAWTDKLNAAELKHARRSYDAMAFAALGDDTILDKEIDGDNARRALEADKIRQKNDQGCDVNIRRVKRRISERPAVNLDGVLVWCAESVAEELGIERSARHKSVIFICDDVAAPEQGALLTAGLCGGVVCDKAYYNSSGKGGARVTYLHGGKTPRSVWLSPAFRAAHPQFSNLIDSCLGGPDWSWTMLASAEAFINRVAVDTARPRRKQRPMDTIALVTRAEKAVAPWAALKGALDVVAFLSAVCKVADDGTVRNRCSR
ncbi:hypothetical protein N9L68_04005 [bacterium]|nr:hypothetical protein [bacterium]